MVDKHHPPGRGSGPLRWPSLRPDALHGRLMAGVELVREAFPYLGDGNQRLGKPGEIERNGRHPVPEVDGSHLAEALNHSPLAARQLKLDVPMKEGELIAVRCDDRVRASDAPVNPNLTSWQRVSLGQVLEVTEAGGAGPGEAATGAGVRPAAAHEKGPKQDADKPDGHGQQRDGSVAHGARSMRYVAGKRVSRRWSFITSHGSPTAA